VERETAGVENIQIETRVDEASCRRVL
jgi:hypothetical protein